MKILKDNSQKHEVSIEKKTLFLLEHLISNPSWLILQQLDIKEGELLNKINKNINGVQPSDVPAKVRSSIKQLHRIEDYLIEERNAIKGQLNDDDIVFAYDAILKRSVLRNRKLVFLLTYYL